MTKKGDAHDIFDVLILVLHNFTIRYLHYCFAYYIYVLLVLNFLVSFELPAGIILCIMRSPGTVSVFQ